MRCLKSKARELIGVLAGIHPLGAPGRAQSAGANLQLD
jgi:hypothetical protein